MRAKLRSLKSAHTEIWQHPAVPEAWLAELLGRHQVNAQQPRKHEKVSLPNGQPALFKLMAASRHRFEPWSSINFLPRLKPRFADNEGRAYRHFSATGLATPTLYAYGESWHFGLRGRGFVLVEWLDWPLLADRLNRAITDSAHQEVSKICCSWMDYLVAVHNSGRIHGDADSDNFLLDDKDSIIAIDLEKSQPLNPKNHQKELNRAKRCLAEHGVGNETIEACIQQYHSRYAQPVDL